MKTKLLIIIAIAITLITIFYVLGLFQGHVAEYLLNDGQFDEIILNNNNDGYSTYDQSNQIMPIELKIAKKLKTDVTWYFSGTVIDSETDIKISVRSPNEKIVFSDTITPFENGDFEIKFMAVGSLWDIPGKYVLILNQGKFTEIKIFEILESDILKHDTLYFIKSINAPDTVHDGMDVIDVLTCEELKTHIDGNLQSIFDKKHTEYARDRIHNCNS